MEVTIRKAEDYLYPSTHWSELERFIVGDDTDPKGCFRLADDVWEAWRYSSNKLPSEAYKYRFNFGGLRSFLKLYAKRYCYYQLIGRGGPIGKNAANLPSDLYLADQYLVERKLTSLLDIASPDVFIDLWDAQMVDQTDEEGALVRRSFWRQKATRPFWIDLSTHFNLPLVIPRINYSKKKHPTKSADDESQVIPLPVIRQFVNKLALHRDGRERLNPFHHLRLCVLVLVFCLGRRISEILTAPRCSGVDGPLSRYPSRNGTVEGGLWFNFNPNKRGPKEYVYVSTEWEDVTLYCVRELIRYSDEVRHLAAVEERGLLILISRWNWTSGSAGRKGIVREKEMDLNRQGALGGKRHRCVIRNYKMKVGGLSYGALRRWLYGAYDAKYRSKFHSGVLEEWGITCDGSSDGEIYKLRTHQARRTRATALAKDPKIPLLIKQRDLNHSSREMQFAYQHALKEEHKTLLVKMRNGELLGNGVQWLHRIVGLKEQSEPTQSGYREGRPGSIDERFRRLIVNNPQFLQFYKLKIGYCVKAQGPLSCSEYLCCTEAKEGGCSFFVTDPSNECHVRALAERGCDHRVRQQESLQAGRKVQAGKYETLAHRTEDIHRRALEVGKQLEERMRQVGVKHL